MVLLSICLIFCQFKPGVAYKSIAYKKACTLKIQQCFRKIKKCLEACSSALAQIQFTSI